MDRYQELHAKLAAAGQQQLLRFWSQLDADQQARLAGQLDDIDFAELEKLIKEYVLQRPKTQIPEDLGPAPYFPLVPARRGAKGALREGAGPRRRAAARGAGLLPDRRGRTGDAARLRRPEGDLSDRAGDRQVAVPVFRRIHSAHR